MAHDVKFSVPQRPVGNADIEFVVDQDGKKMGTLKVSKGAIEWLPRDHSYGQKLAWGRFAELMEARGQNGRT